VKNVTQLLQQWPAGAVISLYWLMAMVSPAGPPCVGRGELAGAGGAPRSAASSAGTAPATGA